MNWGHKIALAFVLFAAFIIYMVVGAFQQNIDLVTPDYYAREIAFDDKMNQRANFNELEEIVELKQSAKEIIFSFPKSGQYVGEILFYHPSEQNFDKTFPIELSSSSTQTVDKQLLVKGYYRINITWKDKDKSYFQQENIFIQ